VNIEQRRWTQSNGWTQVSAVRVKAPHLILVFGSRDALQGGREVQLLRSEFPRALLIGCSTAGEILNTQVTDDTIVATALEFERTRVKSVEIGTQDAVNSFEAGRQLAHLLPKDGLVHAFVVSDGQDVNGSELARGIQQDLPAGVAVTGGLAGDGSRFQQTLVFTDHEPRRGRIALVGFYGSGLHIGYGSLGGWDTFGPHRIVTRSAGNVLYELDGQPALALYKRYLGEHAAGLPATGLLFPLSVQIQGHDHEVTRTILGVNEEQQSLTFAGDVPRGASARLMKANFDRLVDGAHGAAQSSFTGLGDHPPELAILISCVGRKLVLRQRTEQELEAVREVLGPGAAMAGFYSYGEICPAAPQANCELHNQTMTITTLSEH
jgi:hypothetical protein